MVLKSKFSFRYGKRGISSASKIQRAWRKKRTQRDRVKTYGDVRKAVQATAVSSVICQETNLSLITTPTVQQNLSNLEFSNSNDRPDSRKSKQVTVGHISFRCYLEVGDRTNLCRVMVVRNKNPATTNAFNPNDIFNVNNGVGTQPTTMFRDPNLREVEVKYDRVFNLQSTSETAPATRVQNVYWTFNVPIKETFKYFTEANNTQEQTRNMKDYYLVAFSDSAILPNPSLRAVSYLWFKNVGNTA